VAQNVSHRDVICLWSVDTRQKFDTPKGFFGAACSPLVDDGRVLMNIGGPNGAGIGAFDAATGKVLWTATNDEAGYSAPVVATIGGASGGFGRKHPKLLNASVSS